MAKKLAFDWLLFSAVVLLLVLGFVMVYSASGVRSSEASTNFALTPLGKQIFAASVGLLLMGVAMYLDYRKLKNPWFAYAALLGVFVLLAAVLWWPARNGVHRWIVAPGFSVQPSELAKLVVVLFLAYQVDRKWERISHWAFIVPAVTALGLLCALVAIEPDLGTATIIGLIGCSVLFLGGLPWRIVGAAGLFAALFFWLAVMMVPYRRDRVTGFLERDALGDGWQQEQSLIAVGSGGLTGVGLGKSKQKMRFLPFANSDFIYAILCEELGLLGGAAVLAVFLVIAWRGFLIGLRAPDHFGRYLAWGLTCVLLVQALVHMSVTLKLVPVTGTPLPFLSYGGSSLVTSLLTSGVLLNVSQHA